MISLPLTQSLSSCFVSLHLWEGDGCAAGGCLALQQELTVLFGSFKVSQRDFFSGSQCPSCMVGRAVLALQKTGCTRAVVCILHACGSPLSQRLYSMGTCLHPKLANPESL